QHRLEWATARDTDVLHVAGRVRRADGAWCWFSARHVAFRRTADGRPWQWLGIVDDVSDGVRRAAQQALAHPAHQRERVADISAAMTTVVHDLRNPLSNVVSLAYLL